MNNKKLKQSVQYLSEMLERFDNYTPANIDDFTDMADDVLFYAKQTLAEAEKSEELISAALNMVDVRGRYHSEQAMYRLDEAAKNYREQNK